MFHDKRRTDCIEGKGAREVDRTEFPPALLKLLAIIVQKSRCSDYEAKLAQIGGKRRCNLETGIVQKIDRWLSATTKRDHMLKLILCPDGFDHPPE